MTDISARRTANLWLWTAVVAVASVVLSMKLQCVLPFAALAAFASLHLRAPQGLALLALAWGINQGLGYTVLGYPQDWDSYAWGGVLGLGAVAALGAADIARRALAGQSYALTAPVVLAAAFVMSQAVLFAARLWLPATDYAFSPAVVAQIGLVTTIAFMGLIAAHAAVAATGVIDRRRTA